MDAQRPGAQPRRGVGEQRDRLGGDGLRVLGRVGEQQGRGDGGEHLAPVGGRRVGRKRGEVGPEHLHGLAHPPGGDEGLGAAAYEAVHVDVVGDVGQPVEEVERLEELHGRLVGTAHREGLVAGLDPGPHRGRRSPARREWSASSAAVPVAAPDRSASLNAVCRRVRSPGSRSS